MCNCVGSLSTAEAPAPPAAAEPPQIFGVVGSLNFAAAAVALGGGMLNPAAVVQSVADAAMLLEFPNSDEVISEAIWQDFRTPLTYAGTPISVFIELAGDGAASASATFEAQLERGTNFDILAGSSFGSNVTVLNTTILAAAGRTTMADVTFTTPGQRDGLVANEPFRLRLRRALLDPYAGSVFFRSGVVRF